MIPAVIAVRNALQVAFPSQETFSLEHISNSIEAYTKIDTVEFVGYNTSAANPIWGEFLRFTRFLPYRGKEEVVEVRYATHLPVDCLRFVVTKELCHALDSRAGAHTVSNSAVTTLITTLSLISGAQSGAAMSMAVNAERLAEICAMEILIPLRIRQAMIASGEYAQLGSVAIGARLEVPATSVSEVFDPAYMQIAPSVFP